MFQFQVPSSRPMTTAHLAQTMALLTLTTDELNEKIESELASNPALEVVEERRCPKCHRLLTEHGACPVCSLPSNISSEEPVVFLSPRDEFIPKKDYIDTEVDEEPYAPVETELPTYVLRQIAPDLQPDERSLAAFMLTHLDEDGFLTTTLLDIAQYCHVTVEKVRRVQQLIQRADPVGVGSLDTREALMVQLDVLAEVGSVPSLAKQIVSECMDLLSHHQYVEIAHKFAVSQKQVAATAQFISENLNPFPGRSHWGDMRQPGSDTTEVYHRPDIIINFLNEDPEKPLVVEIIMPISGTLQVNPLFKQAVQEADSSTKEELKGDLDKASLFVKCLQQRNHTMERLLSRVVSLQRDFILHGEKYLQPVTRAQISKELEVHESTISRAVANKAVQLPNKKIIPLSVFFDRSLNIRTVLKEIIGQESAPLSDSDLVELLSEQGYNVARRTVAKYRSIEGILPAHLRKVAAQH
ncbi:MAG: RNA polymerase sigma-54 factor [Anaerolineaceae bacterium]